MPDTSAARTDALNLLRCIDPVEYGRSRNYLAGAVTRLSPFLRHGILSLAEVRDDAVAKAGKASACFKLIQELAWRDYYQRLWLLLGEQVWSDLEPYKTGFAASQYAPEIPADILSGSTGIDYIDYFVNQLYTTGYLHNHARMWMAAYIIHGRRVQWQAGARWFYSHLLDGDEASNNLSWQWCASTFSHKPYVYNRETVVKFSGGQFAEHQAADPFDTDYETLARSLFPDSCAPTEPSRRLELRTDVQPPPPAVATDPATTLVWVHDGMMSFQHPAVAMGQTHVFIWDDQRIAVQQQGAGRISFQRSALFCRDEHSHGRAVSEVLIDVANAGRFKTIVTGFTPDPHLLRSIAKLKMQIDVQIVHESPFVDLNGKLDLSRFSRYWEKAGSVLLE